MLRYESFELVKSWYDNFRYNQSKCATVKDKSFTKLNKTSPARLQHLRLLVSASIDRWDRPGYGHGKPFPSQKE
jgi:hypothetical protein